MVSSFDPPGIPLAKVRIACSTSGFCVSSSDELSSAMIAVAAPSLLRKVGTKSPSLRSSATAASI